MKRYILDSGIVSLILDHTEPVFSRFREARRQGHRLGIGTPVLGELLAGLKGSRTEQVNRQKLDKLLRVVKTWDYASKAAEQFAELRAHTKLTGRRVGDLDLQTAAIARTFRRCVVVTMDTDFDALPGITVENWAVP
jgi:predicted nucleic acid-binding protein